MKIEGVYSFKNVQKKAFLNNQNLNMTGMPIANKSYADSLQNDNGNYGKALVGMKSNPSFGIALVDDLIILLLSFSPLIIYYGGGALLDIIKSAYDSKVYEKERAIKEAEAKKLFEQDIEKIANTLNISPKNAKKYHEKYLAVSYIRPTGKADTEIGMNAVRGYGAEKYKLMKDLLSPIVMTQVAVEKASKTNDIKDKALVLKAQRGLPNGVLLYGPPGTGKTYIAHKIGEHLKQFGTEFVNLQLYDTDDTNNRMLNATVQEAKDHFKETGKYTVILLNDVKSLLKGGTQTFDTLLNHLESAKESGVVFLFTVNEAREVNKAMFRQGRLDIKMPIGKMENFENADMINFALHAFDETKKYVGKFDIKKVVDKMEEEKWAFTPAEFMDFARVMSKSRIVTEDEMIELMRNLARFDEYTGMQWNALTETEMANFKDDEKFVKTMNKEQKKLARKNKTKTKNNQEVK